MDKLYIASLKMKFAGVRDYMDIEVNVTAKDMFGAVNGVMASADDMDPNLNFVEILSIRLKSKALIIGDE